MRILRQKRGPPKPTDWRRLALATMLRYATPVGQGKTKPATQRISSEILFINRLAPFYPAIRPQIPPPFTDTISPRFSD